MRVRNVAASELGGSRSPVGLQSFEGLTGAGESDSNMQPSHGCQQEVSAPRHKTTLQRATGVSSRHGSWLLLHKRTKRAR